MHFRARALCAAILGFLAISSSVPAQAAERTVVVVLFDGFSPAMADATKVPHLDQIKREGVWSRHLVPAFPTISLTNHTTYATGCWPEHHGMMSNIFIDPKLGEPGEKMNFGDADWRTGCESMWQTAERQGVRAAAFNWVGRWSGTRGKLATYTNPLTARGAKPSDEWSPKRSNCCTTTAPTIRA